MKYLGCVLLVLSGYVMAEEVYYCSDNHNGANGFYNNKQTGQYERAVFHENKFKMKLQDDGNIVIDNQGFGKDLYICSTPYDGVITEIFKNAKSCADDNHNGWFFNFNTNTGKYVYLRASGYVFGDGDDVETRIGTCTKF